MYFFHGGDSDDRQAIAANLPQALEGKAAQALRESGTQMVFPFVGASMLHERAGKDFFHALFDEVIPAAEKGTLTQAGTRTLAGISMGGTAALNAFFRRPGLFSGMASLCPALFDWKYEDPASVSAYAARTGVSPDLLGLVVGLFKSEFSGQQDYLGTDPLNLVDQAPRQDLAGKPILIEVGDQDMFGLAEGTTLLSKKLFDLDVQHTHRVIADGKHDLDFLRERLPKLIPTLLGSSN